MINSMELIYIILLTIIIFIIISIIVIDNIDGYSISIL